MEHYWDSYKPLETKLDEENGVLTLSLNRKGNALDEHLARFLKEAFERAQEDPRVKLVVLRGKNGAFCGGMDLHSMSTAIKSNRHGTMKKFIRQYLDLFETMDEFKKPIIGVAEKYAIGAGATLLTLCDEVVALEDTTIGYPEKKFKLKPWMSGLYAMRRLGVKQTLDLFRSGEKINGIRSIIDKGLGKLIDDGNRSPTSDRLESDLDEQISRMLGLIAKGFIPKREKNELTFELPTNPDAYDYMAKDLIDHYNSGNREAFKEYAADKLATEMLEQRQAIWEHTQANTKRAV